MLKIPIKTLCLCFCFVEAVWLLLAQVLNSTLLLVPCLICFLVMMVWAALQNVAIPVFLFFLPFAPLLKLAPGTLSFFTLALLVAYAVYAVKGFKNVRITHLVPALGLIVLTLAVKLFNGYPITNNYILLCASLLLVPFMAIELDDRYSRYDFYWATLFFVLGITLAALTSQMLTDFESIARYIREVDELGVIRHSGYYSDPNFYSAHITAAFGGTMILLLDRMARPRRFVLIGAAVVLLYCGLLSVSKSFLLISICLIICWAFTFMFSKGRISSKILMVSMLIVLALFLLSSTAFTDLLDLVLVRLFRGTNMSDFTTRRVDLWGNYFNEFRDSPLILLFGNGCSIDVLVSGRGSHNTLIQMVHQLGLVGSGLLVAWFVSLVKTVRDAADVASLGWGKSVIFLLGVFGPWLALDYLFFDELFLLPIYVCIAFCYAQQTAAPVPMDAGGEKMTEG